DFGDNRIVRWVPGAATETSWVFYPPSGGRLNPSSIQFDRSGSLWITQRSANRVDRFDPSSNTLYSYQNIPSPIHFDIFQGRIYVTSIAATSQVTVIDPNTAAVNLVSNLTPAELTVGTSTPTIPVTVRNSTIVPTDFTSAPTTIDPTTFTVSTNGTLGGLMAVTFPSSNTHGITVGGGGGLRGTHRPRGAAETPKLRARA